MRTYEGKKTCDPFFSIAGVFKTMLTLTATSLTLITLLNCTSTTQFTASVLNGQTDENTKNKGLSQEVTLIHRFLAVDGSWLSVHNLKVVHNNQFDSRVVKVFRDSADITKEVTNETNFLVPLMNGDALIFISGSYEENGKTQRVTRVLPEMPDNRNVSKGSNNEILIRSIDDDIDGKRVDIETTYVIDHDGELLSVVQSIRRGETDLIASVLSGECKFIALKYQDTLKFHVIPSTKGSPTITFSHR
jgi:hypothetical protein